MKCSRNQRWSMNHRLQQQQESLQPFCKDADGHDQVSDSIKINTEVLPSEKKLPGYQLGIGIAFKALAFRFVVLRKKKQD